MTTSSFISKKKAIGMAVLALAGWNAMAQNAPSSSSPSMDNASASTEAKGAKSLDRVDRKFIEETAIAGLFEVETGKLAQTRAADGQVKEFGEHMAQDHSKAGDELKQLSNAKGVVPPTGLDKAHQKELDKLSKLSGAAFDREYMKLMVDGHQKTVAEFQKATKSAKDADIKSFANNTLPTLQEHLKKAQSLNSSVKVSAAK